MVSSSPMSSNWISSSSPGPNVTVFFGDYLILTFYSRIRVDVDFFFSNRMNRVKNTVII